MAKSRNEITLLDIPIEKAAPSIADTVYDAAMRGEGWANILDGLKRSLRADAVALIEYDRVAQAGFIHQSIGLKPGFAGAYKECYAAHDVLLKRLDYSNGASIAVRGEDIASEGLLIGSDFYRDWLAPQELFHSMFQVLMRRDGGHIVCAVSRSESGGRFDDDVMEIFRREAAHLSRALEIHDILCRTTMEREAALAALDQVHVGVIFVDDHGKILESNRIANEVLAENDGLMVDRHGLKGRTREATAGLKELIGLATRPDGQGDVMATDTISLERSFDLPDLAVTICRLPLVGRFLGTNRRAAAIHITSPERRFALDPKKLRQLYKLTPAESRLAALLAQGLRLEDVAADLGVSLNTVRTHLKRIFSKTGTDRQAELVRLILSGPARIMTSGG